MGTDLRVARGFSLVEVLIVAAIVALLTAAAAMLMELGAHPLAASSAAMQFDAALSYARSLAASGSNGATILVTGSQMSIYSGRPTSAGALSLAPIPPFSFAGASIAEATAGSPPLALFVDGEGRVTVAGFSGSTPAPMDSEPACPAGGVWSVRFTDPRTDVVRSLPCNAPAASP